jgi:trimeric autotransporter adhesin
MKGNKHMKTITKFIYPAFAALAIACFAFSLQAQPAPETPDPGSVGGSFNTADGTNALGSVTTGAANSAFGWFSLFSNTDGSFNTGVGAGTLLFNIGDQTTSEGIDNTAVGAAALLFNTTGSFNVAVGVIALRDNTSGFFNNAVGAAALDDNVVGSFNNAHGRGALQASDGDGNNAFGDAALFNNVSGSFNTAIGDLALENSTGSFNTALGASAGSNQDTGSNNIYIGDTGVAGESNVIAIGGSASSGTAYTDTFIGGIHDSVETEQAVFVGADGHLGTVVSSRRYKEEVKPMDKASEALFALKPVSFRYKQEFDPSHRLSFGLIAEDVAEISADLVSRDREGNPKTVRYEAINAMLLNEFLKEHRTVQDQQKEIDALKAELKEQRAFIQNVNDKVELNRPASQTIADNQ